MDNNKDLYEEFVTPKASNATSSSNVLPVNAKKIHNEYGGILCDLHSELNLLKKRQRDHYEN